MQQPSWTKRAMRHRGGGWREKTRGRISATFFFLLKVAGLRAWHNTIKVSCRRRHVLKIKGLVQTQGTLCAGFSTTVGRFHVGHSLVAR